MVRAVFFDFYSVWAPDQITPFLDISRQHGADAADTVAATIGQYFQGQVGVEELAATLRYNLNRSDIDASQFVLSEQNIAPALVDFMRGLHAHFLKLGVLANLGQQEYQLLSSFNEHNQLFEVIGGPLPFGMEQLLSQNVFAKAMQDIGEPPESCLVVSGHQDYLSFAQSLGMRALPFEGFPKLQAAIEQIIASEAA